MGHIEVQYREDVFAQAIQSELNELDLPLEQLEAALPGDSLIDSWECTNVEFPDFAPQDQATAIGGLIVQADILLRLTTEDDAQAAGSGAAPATIPVSLSLRVGVSGTTGAGGSLARAILGAEIDGDAFPIPAMQLDPIQMPEIEDVDITQSWAGRGSGNVVFRIGTTGAGPLWSYGIYNRLPEGEDWAFLLSGRLLEETVEGLMTGALAESSQAKIEKGGAFQANWLPIYQSVVCNGWIVVPDQCEFVNVDVSVELTTTVSFSFDPNQAIPLRMRVHIAWDASDWDTFRCAFAIGGLGLIAVIVGAFLAFINPALGAFVIGVGLGFLLIFMIAIPIATEDIVDSYASSARPPPDLQKVAEDDDSVTYAGGLPLGAPSIGGVTAVMSDMAIDASGLLFVGKMSFAPTSRSLITSVLDPWYATAFSCDTMVWSSDYQGSRVVLSSFAPNFRLRRPPEVNPSSDWQVVGLDDLMALRDAPIDVSLQPTGDLVPGSVADVLVHTTAGLRWVQFAPIPSAPESPSEQELLMEAIQCEVESTKQRPKDWPFGFFNPKWHVDPPPYEQLFRHWGIVYDRLPADAIVRFAVVDDDGKDEDARQFAVSYANANGKVAEALVTSAHERLVIDVDGKLGRPVAPRMRQQWLSAIAEVSSDGLVERAGARAAHVRAGLEGSASVLSGLAGRRGRRGRAYVALSAATHADRHLGRHAVYDQGHWLVSDGDQVFLCIGAGVITQQGAP